MARTRNKREKMPADSGTSGVKIRGFFRVRIVEDGDRIVGDSGWVENKVVNLGIRDYLCTPLAGGTAKSISRMALGTGTVPAATDTSLNGELSHQTNAASGSRNRIAIGTTSQIGSTAIEFQAVFQSATSFATTTANIANILVIDNNTASNGTIFAGNTFASSLLNTNQDVQASYRITFSST